MAKANKEQADATPETKGKLTKIEPDQTVKMVNDAGDVKYQSNPESIAQLLEMGWVIETAEK